jgi:hypothetical protein
MARRLQRGQSGCLGSFNTAGWVRWQLWGQVRAKTTGEPIFGFAGNPGIDLEGPLVA